MRSRKASSGSLGRRQFLATAAAAAGTTLLAGCEASSTASTGLNLPPGTVPAGAIAGDAPEVSRIKIGIIALTDCSPMVIAHEKGLFAKYGISSTISKGASWAAIRDALSNGEIQATHMLLGMPIASTMGLLGAPKKAMVVPWIINRNGQAITLKADLKGKVQDDPKVLKPIVAAAKAAGKSMTFAQTFPTGTHAMWMRYFLGAGGIHPDKDVALATVSTLR